MGRGHPDHGDSATFAAEIDGVNDTHEVLGVEGTACQICMHVSSHYNCILPAGNG